mmetsp:Transcript_6182/g.14979  ORF Transcript_6182/g.14979 Transcript_6182/m.14979 type:complete len:161 (-) Transcript_6182:679-1161(-)
MISHSGPRIRTALAPTEQRYILKMTFPVSPPLPSTHVAMLRLVLQNTPSQIPNTTSTTSSLGRRQGTPPSRHSATQRPFLALLWKFPGALISVRSQLSLDADVRRYSAPATAAGGHLESTLLDLGGGRTSPPSPFESVSESERLRGVWEREEGFAEVDDW